MDSGVAVILKEIFGYLLILAVIIGVNYLARTIAKYLFEDGYGVFSGGIWFLAVLVVIGLFIPPVGKFVLWIYNSAMEGLFNSKPVESLPAFGTTFFWVLLGICLLITVLLWICADSCYGPVTKTIFMIVFGAIHSAVVVCFGPLVIIIVVFVLLSSGSSLIGSIGSHISSLGATTKSEPEPEKEVKVWREHGDLGAKEYLKVSSDGERYFDPEDGQWHKIEK